MANDTFMKSDKNLDADVNKAQTPDEIREMLYRAVERSQIGFSRDPVSGRFTSTGDPATAASAAEPHTYTRSVMIGGQTFDFTANDPETLEVQINAAREVYAHLENAQSDAVDEPTAAEIEAAHQRKLFNDMQAQSEFQRGEISVKEYLERTGAVGDYLESQGIDIDQLRENTQAHEAQVYEQSWAQAVQKFLSVDGPGADWPGGKNQKLIETALIALGLSDQPSVESLAKAYDYLKQNGTLFPHEAEVTQADIVRATEKMAPAEILELWKQSQPGASYGDGTKANEAFISQFRKH